MSHSDMQSKVEFLSGDREYLQAIVDVMPGFEHSILVDARSEIADGTHTYSIEEMQRLRPSGNVIGSNYRNGQLSFLIEKWSHKLDIGNSGSGKSTKEIASQLLANILTRTSCILIDPKGEHYKRTAAQVIQAGGEAKLLNMRDPAHSEVINPLTNAAKIIAQIAKIGQDVTPPKGKFGTWHYRGNIYRSKDELERVFKDEFETAIRKTKREVKDIVSRLWEVKSQKDPFWEHTAWRMIEAVIYGLCMDQLDKKRGISEKKINFNNVNKIYSCFENEGRCINDCKFFTKRGKQSWVYAIVKNLYFQQSEQTLRNQMGFTDEAFAKYDVPSFMELTLGTSITVEDLVNRFTVLYIDFDEMDEISMTFLSFLVSFFIKELKNLADGYENGALPRPINIIIDEFATLPKMEDVKKAFAYLRSRNIFLHIALQSYSQLSAAYGEDDANSIIENCDTQIFLGSNDFKTIERLSRDFGSHATVMPYSDLKSGHIDIKCLPVLTCSDLAYMEKDAVYVKRNRQSPLRTDFAKSYEHPEFGTVKTLPKDYVNPIAKDKEAYLYNTEDFLD